jgi:hypothetical protein
MKIKESSLGLLIALTFAACSTNQSEQSLSKPADSLGISADMPSDLPGDKAKLVKTADIDFEVKDVYKSSMQLSQTARNLGGLVMLNDIKTSELNSKTIPLSYDSIQVISSYTIDALLTVKLPSEFLDAFLDSVTTEATIIYTSSRNIEDRSIDYAVAEWKQKSHQKILDKQLKKDSLKNDDFLQLANQQDKIIDGKAANLRTNANARFSTITLHFTQNALLKKENRPNVNLDAYQPSSSKRLGIALSSGWDIFLTLIIGVSYIWPLLVLGIAGWAGYRLIARRQEAKA